MDCKEEEKKREEEKKEESNMCSVYSNSCSYLLFISKSHSLFFLFRSQAKKCYYTIEPIE